jgi:hypothetical protein
VLCVEGCVICKSKRFFVVEMTMQQKRASIFYNFLFFDVVDTNNYLQKVSFLAFNVTSCKLLFRYK